jgi:hypothetical protein
MKWLVLTISILIVASLFYSCATVEPYLYKSYRLNDTLSVSVGSPLFSHSEGFQSYSITQNKQIIEGVGQELIYTGIVGNNLKLYYREYSESYNGTFLKSPFSLELQYDLSQDTFIMFRKYLIQVLSANQRSITYVIRNEPAASYYTDNEEQSSTKTTSSIYPVIKIRELTKEFPCSVISEDSISILIKNMDTWNLKRYQKDRIEYIRMPNGSTKSFNSQ